MRVNLFYNWERALSIPPLSDRLNIDNALLEFHQHIRDISSHFPYHTATKTIQLSTNSHT